MKTSHTTSAHRRLVLIRHHIRFDRLTAEYSLLSAVLLCIVFVSCNPITPPPPVSPRPDTTSHEFTWRIDTLGDGNSSVLYDVAIIDENNIWAVGEIYLRDSTGQIDPTAYGLAKWNGSDWLFQRLTAFGPGGYSVNLRPRGIFANSQADIWFVAGGVFRMNNGSITAYWINEFPGNPNPIWAGAQSAEKLWASSPSDVYAVGTNGAIAHFHEGNWTKIQSGTTVDLTDVCGTADGGEIWACGFRDINQAEGVLLQYKAQMWYTTWSRSGGVTPPFGDYISSLWCSSRTAFISSNYGVFHISRGDSVQQAVKQLSLSSFPYRVRGYQDNDVFVVGDNAMIWHWNGASWKQVWSGPATQPFYSVAVEKDQVIAVGADHSQGLSRALVIRGRRQ